MRVEFNSGLHVLALLRAMIDQENSRHSVNQSDAKVKTIASWSFASSRISNNLFHFELLWENRLCVFWDIPWSSLFFFFLRSQWPSPHPTYQRALTQLFEMCSWGVLNQSLTRDRLLRNSLDIHSLLKCERKLATSIFFSLNSVNLNYSSEAVSFINAAHSDISPTCDRVVSLDPELVKIFRKVITLCVTSACLNAERQSWIQEFFDWRVWSLIHFFFLTQEPE